MIFAVGPAPDHDPANNKYKYEMYFSAEETFNTIPEDITKLELPIPIPNTGDVNVNIWNPKPKIVENFLKYIFSGFPMIMTLLASGATEGSVIDIGFAPMKTYPFIEDNAVEAL